MIVCDLCERPKFEHAREALAKSGYRWAWPKNACPVGINPFHPTQVYTVRTENGQ